jgi:hypothetical protein
MMVQGHLIFVFLLCLTLAQAANTVTVNGFEVDAINWYVTCGLMTLFGIIHMFHVRMTPSGPRSMCGNSHEAKWYRYELDEVLGPMICFPCCFSKIEALFYFIMGSLMCSCWVTEWAVELVAAFGFVNIVCYHLSMLVTQLLYGAPHLYEQCVGVPLMLALCLHRLINFRLLDDYVCFSVVKGIVTFWLFFMIFTNVCVLFRRGERIDYFHRKARAFVDNGRNYDLVVVVYENE